MISDQINSIVDVILDSNDVFTKGEYYADTLEDEANRFNDSFSGQFYIRHRNYWTKVSTGLFLQELTTELVFVARLESGDPEANVFKIAGQLRRYSEHINITDLCFDGQTIADQEKFDYKADYKYFSIQFSYTFDEILDNCEPVCL